MPTIRKYWLRNAKWANKQKTSVNATRETVNDDTGETSREDVIINVGSDDWHAVLDHVGISRLDTNSEPAKKDADIVRDQEISAAAEQLFQMKIDAMELEAVRLCDDRKVRSAIRKSKNAIELNANVAVAAAMMTVKNIMGANQSDDDTRVSGSSKS